jgi:hypothetical protein
MSVATKASPSPNAKREPIGMRISRLANECREGDVTLAELTKHMEGQSRLLLVFLVSLPFCQPVPLLGLSTPFGLLLFLLGWQILLGREFHLSQRFQGLVIPRKFFPTLLAGAGRLLRWLEKRLRPQWQWALRPPWVTRLCGANILVCSALLALPLPIPASNVFPALPIAISAAALLEDDGKMLMYAAVAAMANVIFWTAWAILIGVYGWEIISQWF